jgi:hypothetical protein
VLRLPQGRRSNEAARYVTHFICGLFKVAVCGSDSITSNGGMISDDLETLWKEVVVAYFKVQTLAWQE